MTFSIIGMEKKAIGVGVVSGSTAVRDRVPWVRKGIGAIATQGYTETMYGERGLSLLEKGEDPREILKKLTEEDPELEKRQVAIVDIDGRKAAHTGSSCPREKNSVKGENCVAIGNTLENKKTVPAMVKNFERSDKNLALRIIKALEKGARVGGDRRGNRTAALVVKGRERVDVGVGFYRKPIEELKGRYENRG